MRFFLLSLILLVNLIPFHSSVYAAGSPSSGDSSVYDAIQDGGEKTPAVPTESTDSNSSSIFPIIMKFLGSLAVVIVLILGLFQFIDKKGRRINSSGPVLQLAGHSVGQNRSLQVVLIGQTIYILGVGEDVTLIRSISKGEEYQQLLESYENQSESLSTKWPQKQSSLIWNSIFQKHIKKMEQENQRELDE